MSDTTFADRSRPCRSCHAAIVMIAGPGGKFFPAQLVTQVYALEAQLPGLEGTAKLELVHAGEFYINHFQTCPQAADHSRRS